MAQEATATPENTHNTTQHRATAHDVKSNAKPNWNGKVDRVMTACHDV